MPKIRAAYLLLITSLISGIAGYSLSCYLGDAHADKIVSDPVVCKEQKIRLKGYKFIKPLLFTESACESPEMMNVKSELIQLIERYKASGVLQNASVYLRSLNQGEWMEINPDQKYLPGSLMKVPILISFMKMNEAHPGFLDKKVVYDQSFITDKNPIYTSKSIEYGKTYSIRELLEYMIVHSDNKATALLGTYLDRDMIKAVFTDLGIPEPDFKANEIAITASHYSRFLRAIFNSASMTTYDSEFCAELLSKANFDQGIRGGVPSEIPIANKFGEAGSPGNYFFCESAIVYMTDAPYLITVMTQGKDLSVLPGLVKDISGLAYQFLGA